MDQHSRGKFAFYQSIDLSVNKKRTIFRDAPLALADDAIRKELALWELFSDMLSIELRLRQGRDNLPTENTR